MKGLTDDERLLIECALKKTRLDRPDLYVSGVNARLVAQGRLTMSGRCNCADAPYDHVHLYPTSTSKLALELDTIARTKGEFGL